LANLDCPDGTTQRPDQTRFGENRRFIRCDQFSASPRSFPQPLSTSSCGSESRGSGPPPSIPILQGDVDRPRQCRICARSTGNRRSGHICGRGGAEPAQQYFASHYLPHSLVPTGCERFNIPTPLQSRPRATPSTDLQTRQRSDHVDEILRHSIPPALNHFTCHCRVSQSVDMIRLTKSGAMADGVLETEHNKSLSATIELSLASTDVPRTWVRRTGILGIIAVLPSCVNEENSTGCFREFRAERTSWTSFASLP